MVGTLEGVAQPSEGSGGCAMSPGRNGRNTARVSRRDASRPRRSFRCWGGTESGASHLKARLPGRQGRPARLETQQYSPQGSPPSDTGSGRRGSRQCAICLPRGGPGSAFHPWASSASLSSRVAPPPLTEPPSLAALWALCP